MITLTESAADKLREMIESQGPEEDALRLYTKLGGCTGYSYGMALDAEKPDDHVFSIHGVKVVIDSESLELLDGSEVDYIDDLTGQGFKINNPNATSMCGCGSSFRTATKAGQPGSCD
ncbi:MULTISPECIES: HesB/IscA family protein [Alicyclobacillus]|uniref:Iron-sulfur cluster assembly accessory protein n=1 Tax=Alicyclobacillus acidoterrestris (strain ATCC 49025 / DSM 3922 / CIP 106132 / NCIMB 13137 / GD3B) TaxID=1356854 RepID=T0BVV6_ALIAG|nr:MULTISPECIES: iron-sulfur cluster assembly accessory protein [Alicyclobacillus]EPZ48233.1 heme biosynthesis protein HemY [Alicyclobacillus acidoterrestris ATCC 49025]UNO50443.1 iron-sulfur cluster assembly accessory protein [Alicyclobacillus acidoterrestris]